MKNILASTLVLTAILAFAASAPDKMPMGKFSDMVEKIEIKNLLKMPIGSTLIFDSPFLSLLQEDVASMEVPREWSDGSECDALRVSNILFDKNTKRILGGLGSNVYPTVADGAFAMTNVILSTVSKVSDGKAMCVPLRFPGGKYGEMIFFWNAGNGTTNNLELVVRCFISPKRQMAVCTLLHTQGDGINAFLHIPEPAEDKKGGKSGAKAVP